MQMILDTTPKASIVKWMRCYAAYSRGINATQLAEAAAQQFRHMEWLDDETHWIWDEAADIITSLSGELS